MKLLQASFGDVQYCHLYGYHIGGHRLPHFNNFRLQSEAKRHLRIGCVRVCARVLRVYMFNVYVGVSMRVLCVCVCVQCAHTVESIVMC